MNVDFIVATCDADEVIATQRRCYKKPMSVSKNINQLTKLFQNIKFEKWQKRKNCELD